MNEKRIDPSNPPVCSICGELMPPGEEMFKFHGYSGPCPKPPLAKDPDPQSDLGKLLLAIVQSVGSSDPQAFLKVNVSNAIKQADEIKA